MESVVWGKSVCTHIGSRCLLILSCLMSKKIIVIDLKSYLILSLLLYLFFFLYLSTDVVLYI